MTKANLTADEIRLVATLAKMEKQQENAQFDALYLKISETPDNERAQSIKTMSAMFAPVLDHKGGAKFFLLNGDMVILYPYLLKIIMERIVSKILFFVAPSQSEDFAVFYDLRNDLKTFFDYIKKQVSKTLVKLGDKEVYVDADEEPDFSEYYSDTLAVDLYATNDMIPKNLKETEDEKKLKSDKRVLSPTLLADNESALSNFNFAACIVQNPIMRINSGRTQKVFTELSIDIEKFRQVIFPQVDFNLSPFLFMNLTKKFDQGLLGTISGNGYPVPKKKLALNLNMSSFLSPDFLRFDEVVPNEDKPGILVKFSLVDIFSDISVLPIVRSFAQTCGYSLCFADVPFESLRMLHNFSLRGDYVGIIGREDIITNDDNIKIVNRFLLSSGPSKVIMFKTDSEKVFRIGQQLGIELFAGKYISEHYQ